MFFSSIKEINRLISKEILNIYLEVTIEKNWRSLTSIFIDIIEFENFLLQLKSHWSGSKTVCGLLLFYYFTILLINF